MKKGMLVLSCLLSVAGWSETPNERREVMAIEREIRALKERQHHLHRLENHEEVQGQGEMIADWNTYGREVELIRKQREEEREINKRIHELEEQKALLLHIPPPTH